MKNRQERDKTEGKGQDRDRDETDVDGIARFMRKVTKVMVTYYEDKNIRHGWRYRRRGTGNKSIWIPEDGTLRLQDRTVTKNSRGRKWR